MSHAPDKKQWHRPVIRRFPLEPSESTRPAGMSTRAWLALSACLIILAFQIGWAARSQDTTDRYLQSQTAKNVAAETYFNIKLDSMIQENERSYKSGKQRK